MEDQGDRGAGLEEEEEDGVIESTEGWVHKKCTMTLNTVLVLFVNPQPTAYTSLYAEFYTWSARAAPSCGLAYGNGLVPTPRLGRRLRVFGHVGVDLGRRGLLQFGVDTYRPAVL
eukprot:5855554-Pyramimonas_sp.AAC.1